MLILEIFSGWDIEKGQFNFLVTFLAVFFLVCKLCSSGLQVILLIPDDLKFMAGVDIGDF